MYDMTCIFSYIFFYVGNLNSRCILHSVINTNSLQTLTPASPQNQMFIGLVNCIPQEGKITSINNIHEVNLNHFCCCCFLFMFVFFSFLEKCLLQIYIIGNKDNSAKHLKSVYFHRMFCGGSTCCFL